MNCVNHDVNCTNHDVNYRNHAVIYRLDLHSFYFCSTYLDFFIKLKITFLHAISLSIGYLLQRKVHLSWRLYDVARREVEEEELTL